MLESDLNFPPCLLDENLKHGLLPLYSDIVWKNVIGKSSTATLNQFSEDLVSIFEPCKVSGVQILNSELIP
ncbi:MAG: hypothetical protein OXC40_00280, partial [Proteobacteria bacterium]|nr:hypothetical protein [Pseudomonadota bacterium]